MSVFKDYKGGKNRDGVYQWLINHIPECDVLIVPFLGNCGLIQNLNAFPDSIVGIDLDKRVTEAWAKMTMQHGSIANKTILQVINQCGIKYLKTTMQDLDSSKKYVIYCDPPYPMECRSHKKNIYSYEFSNHDHLDLINLLLFNDKRENVFLLISTYENNIYSDYLSSWHRSTYLTYDRRNNPKTELLYSNFNIDNYKLLDYSYIGNNYTCRQIIKRKLDRTLNKIKKLNFRERELLIKSISQRWK